MHCRFSRKGLKGNKNGLQIVTIMIKFIVKLPFLSGSIKGPCRKRQKGKVMDQNGYHPQGARGYGTGQPGYGVPQFTASAGYTQNREQGYVPQNAQYSVPGSFMQQAPFGTPGQQTGYNAYPQQGGTGSFIPQTPYSPGYTSPDYQPPQPGYVQPGGYQQPANGYSAPFQSLPNSYHVPPAGYQPQNGYQQQNNYMPGYNPYGQMGRTPYQGQTPENQIPLNGGGYIPQRVQVRKKGFEFRDWYLIVSGAVLIALFVAAVLLLKSTPLKILLILLAAGSAGILWIKPVTAENRRLTYSILALALCILTAVSFLMKPNTDTTKTPGGQPETAAAVTDGNGGEQTVPEIPANAQGMQVAAAETEVPEIAANNQLLERLVAFFTYWSGNRQDEMLNLCAPSWKEKQENPRTSLFGLLANRTPRNITPESITGTDADTSRKVILTVSINRNNGKPDELYRMTIMMVKESNDWYIDPQSLQTNESLETPDPNITPTPAPTETPAVYSDTTLYYNPKGGEYYHLDPNCKIINPKFLPLGGTFTYSQIGNEPFDKLKPCNVCGAPLRP